MLVAVDHHEVPTPASVLALPVLRTEYSHEVGIVLSRGWSHYALC